MEKLFSNPRGWTGHLVKSWFRFWLTWAGLTAIIAYAIFQAADSGVRSAFGLSLFIVVMQFYMLYALRRLYFEAEGKARAVNAV
jgi:hypothetical protein